ncbi:MAG: TonB-dependent receptor plug domain-containing protein, partial [Pseudomonadota bacterium]
MFSKRIFMFCVYGLMAVAMSAKAQLEEVIVVAHPLAEGGLAQAVEVLEGEELDEVKAGSLGETLAGTAGVQSSSFGTAVGRPVIHGLGATRVKTTQDQIDTLDVSVVSGDHAVTTDAFIADRISVLKGSSTLLYGSGAIGGVVDVDTGRHALTVPEEFSGRAEARFSDVDDGTTLAARLDGRLSDNVAWHVDAFSRDGDDYEIPGFVESARFIAAEEAEEEEEGHDEHEEEGHDEEEEARDILEGSRNERSGGAVSLSFVGDRSHFSVALSGLTGEYGLVGGHGHHEEGHDEDEEEHHDDEDEEHHDDEEEHHDEEEEGVGILDMEQTRVDIRAGYQFDGSFIEKVDFLFGQNDYEHLEIEGNGEAGTEFSNEAWEARFELHHTPILGFDGLFGLQFNDREFSALGEEAFVQPVDSSSQALFWIGEKDTDFGSIEAGFRFESTDHEPFGGSTQPDTSFDTFSASFGLISEVSEQLTLSFLIDSSSRAPA